MATTETITLREPETTPIKAPVTTTTTDNTPSRKIQAPSTPPTTTTIKEPSAATVNHQSATTKTQTTTAVKEQPPQTTTVKGLSSTTVVKPQLTAASKTTSSTNVKAPSTAVVIASSTTTVKPPSTTVVKAPSAPLPTTTKALSASVDMAANKSNDQLIEILKQIQARKTVKPEDATKALQQYHKVQEQIKVLKTEIELFKSNKAKESQDATASKLPVKSSSSGVSRKNSIKTVNTVKQHSPASKPTPKTVNGQAETNDTIPGKGARRASKAFVNDNDKDKGTDKLQGKTSGREEKLKPEEKQQAARETAEKDKELARLMLQNAQLKVALANRAQTGPNSESSPKSSILEQSDIPNQQKLVDEFRRIHDMEYRTAFHDLEKQYKMAEDNITELLAAIAREAYTFCQNASKQQFDDIIKAHANVIDALVQPKYASQFKDTVVSKSKAIVDKDNYVITRKYLKDYRRAMARIPIPGLMEIFESIIQRDVLTRHSSLRIIPKSFRPFMNRLIEVNWFMGIHEPPMAQVWPRGGQLMNRDWFTPYSKKGATVIHTVWPALFYHKEGSLAERGICVVK